MKGIKDFITEAQTAVIDGFMSKISSCQTIDGLKELESFYDKRKKEVGLSDSDDISVRDALKGRREELSAVDEKDPEQF
ncbi:MAG: hypothetical protein [Caudoviricetes sp.]|nr:MAG: hypothetical protein [Caudoviricetes sp.]